MKLTDAQLAELKSRCIKAAARGYAIGQVDQYLAPLSEETGARDVPHGIKKGSAEHLKVLVQTAIDQRSGKKPKPKPVEKPKPKPVEKPKPVKVDEAVEVTEKPKAESRHYEEWSYEDIYKEIQVRGIIGRSRKKTKDELIDMLRKYDKEN